MCNVRPEGFHDPNLAPFLHCDCDKRAHDSKGCDDHDEEQQEKHHGALESHGFEKLAVHVDPGLRVFGRLEKLSYCLFYTLGAVRVVGPDGDAVQPISQPIYLLAYIDRHEQTLGIVQVMPSLNDTG